MADPDAQRQLIWLNALRAVGTHFAKIGEVIAQCANDTEKLLPPTTAVLHSHNSLQPHPTPTWPNRPSVSPAATAAAAAATATAAAATSFDNTNSAAAAVTAAQQQHQSPHRPNPPPPPASATAAARYAYNNNTNNNANADPSTTNTAAAATPAATSPTAAAAGVPSSASTATTNIAPSLAQAPGSATVSNAVLDGRKRRRASAPVLSDPSAPAGGSTSVGGGGSSIAGGGISRGGKPAKRVRVNWSPAENAVFFTTIERFATQDEPVVLREIVAALNGRRNWVQCKGHFRNLQVVGRIRHSTKEKPPRWIVAEGRSKVPMSAAAITAAASANATAVAIASATPATTVVAATGTTTATTSNHHHSNNAASAGPHTVGVVPLAAKHIKPAPMATAPGQGVAHSALATNPNALQPNMTGNISNNNSGVHPNITLAANPLTTTAPGQQQQQQALHQSRTTTTDNEQKDAQVQLLGDHGAHGDDVNGGPHNDADHIDSMDDEKIAKGTDGDVVDHDESDEGGMMDSGEDATGPPLGDEDKGENNGADVMVTADEDEDDDEAMVGDEVVDDEDEDDLEDEEDFSGVTNTNVKTVDSSGAHHGNKRNGNSAPGAGTPVLDASGMSLMAVGRSASIPGNNVPKGNSANSNMHSADNSKKGANADGSPNAVIDDSESVDMGRGFGGSMMTMPLKKQPTVGTTAATAVLPQLRTKDVRDMRDKRRYLDFRATNAADATGLVVRK